MSKYLSCSLVLLGWVVACGGSTGDGEAPGVAGASGSSAAGTSSGGSSNGGTASAGSSSGGSAGNGGSVSAAGTTSNAGTSSGGTSSNGGNGGTGGADSRCPPKLPMGACGAEQTDALCSYDLLSGCLCYPSSQIGARCTQVDPSCTPSAPPPEDAAGGSAAKIALPPERVCRCSGGAWQCT